ncbi:MAG: CC_3452 family protein [Sphingomonas sp.]
MHRPVLAVCALALAAAPAGASTYSAKLAVPTTERIIARDIIWACGTGACQGATDESRPAVLCQSLARRVGKVDSFVADGRAFAPAELDRCNSAAKSDAGKALAAQ